MLAAKRLAQIRPSRFYGIVHKNISGPLHLIAPRDHLGVAQAMQPVRRRVRKTHEHRAAGGGGHAMLWRLPQNFRAKRIGQDEPRVLGHDFDGHGFGDREKKPIAMGAIVPPFAVGAKSAMEDLISTIKIVASIASATISARRPVSSGNSVTVEKLSRRNSRLVPRATKSAVPDWRPSRGEKGFGKPGMADP